MIVESDNWCCERCGMLIKGKCNNIKGRITHINDCLSYEVEQQYENIRRRNNK